MIRLKILFILTFIFCLNIRSQENYRFAVINSKFSFVKSVDGYQTSSLTKFLFTKRGFKSYLNNEDFPQELIENRCDAIFVDVKDESGFLNVKSKIIIKDCNGKILQESGLGVSRLKDYKRAYNQSIRGALKTMKKFSFTKTKPNILKRKKEIQSNNNVTTNNLEILDAYKVQDEFLLFNAKKELLFKVVPTNKKELYIIEDPKGIMKKQGNYWLLEFTKEGKQISKKYRVNF